MKTWRIGTWALVCWLALGNLCGDLQAAEYRMSITFPGYTNRTETLTNFPALVALSNACDSAGVFHYQQFISEEGWDLRFRDAGDTTNLNYEIEQWDTNGTSYVWVQVPELLPDGSSAIWATWGDTGDNTQLPCTTNGATWSEDFRAVWHLGEDNGTSIGDSTARGRTGTRTDGVTLGIKGKVGDSVSFPQSADECISVASDTDFDSSVFTISLWIKTDLAWDTASSQTAVLLSRHDATSSFNGFSILQFKTSGALAIQVKTSNQDYTAYSEPNRGDNKWHRVAFVLNRNGGTHRIYANGIEDVAWTGAAAWSFSNQQVTLGDSIDAYWSSWKGTMDEVRWAHGERSADWVWAEYINMASNAVFSSYGAAEFVAGAPEIANVGAFEVTETSADMVGNLSGGYLPVTVTCYWGTEDGGINPALWQTNVSWSASALGLQTNVVTDGMIPGMRYYFRFHATNAVAGSWAPGNVMVTTLGAPRVENLAATGVEQTGAVLHGTLCGGNPDPEVWIYWGTSDGETNKNEWDQPALSIGSPGLVDFDESVSGLLANQTYWYRCYASNAYDSGSEAWASASTNFTTTLPELTLANASVVEGPQGATTAAVFTITLAAASAQSMSVDYATADGTATTANNDYVAASGTLVIPAGVVATQIVVTVNGDYIYEANETFMVNLSNQSGATLVNTQATGTIVNDDWTFYVRGDGFGNDSNSGVTWATAFATLQKALATAPVATTGSGNIPTSTPIRILVQASGTGQAYDVAARSLNAALDLDFQGGWEEGDTSWAQTGLSRVEDIDGTVNEAGISITGPNHGDWRRVVVDRFVFTNVTRAVSIATSSGIDRADIYLTVSNTVVYAEENGLHVDYPKAHPITTFGGKANITAVNVDIAAGLGGTGHGLYIRGAWMGSSVSAEGLDPATGYPRVSSIRSAGGSGIYFSALNDETHHATFTKTVIYGGSGDGIYLDAYRSDSPDQWYRVQATLNHCTIADNAGDGLRMVSRTSSSWAAVTSSIFAGNSGYGINLGEAGYSAFNCSEGYNVFFDDTLLVNDAAQAPAGTSSSGDPLFFADKTKPHPWYTLGTKASPAYDSATPSGNRGAYQEVTTAQGTVLILK